MSFDSALIRERPDPAAPSAPASDSKTRTAIAILSFLVFLPSTLVKATYFHFSGQAPKGQPYRTTLAARLLKFFLWAKYRSHLPRSHPAEWVIAKAQLGSDKARVGVRIDQVELKAIGEELRQGIAAVPAVKAVARPAWMLTPSGAVGAGLGRAEKGEKVFLYFHGGAYIFGHPVETAFSWSMAKRTDIRLLGVNYRKTLDAGSAHPAPLLDALAGYLYLTRDLAFPPQNIAFMGDSAGGHLCLMLSRYLASINLDQPGALALVSPWCDMTASRGNATFASQVDNYKYDYLPYLGSLSIPSGIRHYKPEVKRTPWFSPWTATSEEWAYLREAGVRVYMMRGTKELLHDEIGMVADGMKRAGVDVMLKDDVGGLHVGPLIRFPGSSSWPVWLEDVRSLLQRI